MSPAHQNFRRAKINSGGSLSPQKKEEEEKKKRARRYQNFSRTSADALNPTKMTSAPIPWKTEENGSYHNPDRSLIVEKYSDLLRELKTSKHSRESRMEGFTTRAGLLR